MQAEKKNEFTTIFKMYGYNYKYKTLWVCKYNIHIIIIIIGVTVCLWSIRVYGFAWHGDDSIRLVIDEIVKIWPPILL